MTGRPLVNNADSNGSADVAGQTCREPESHCVQWVWSSKADIQMTSLIYIYIGLMLGSNACSKCIDWMMDNDADNNCVGWMLASNADNNWVNVGQPCRQQRSVVEQLATLQRGQANSRIPSYLLLAYRRGSVYFDVPNCNK